MVSGEPWQQRISLSEETLFNSAANIRARRLAEQKIEYAAREKRIRGSGATKDDLVWGFARKYKGETQYEDFMNVRKALLKGDMAGAQAGAARRPHDLANFGGALPGFGRCGPTHPPHVAP